MKELVAHLAKALVINPDDVEVSEIRGETTAIIELRVAKADLGRIIGKQGRTAQALRVVINAVAARTQQRVILEIVEEQ
jgi:predicted RNA-binding protein YlqC (UPF0109 family)